MRAALIDRAIEKEEFFPSIAPKATIWHLVAGDRGCGTKHDGPEVHGPSSGPSLWAICMNLVRFTD